MADSSVPASSPLQMKCDLWWQFTVRSVEMRHRGSYLGVIWTVLNPLLMLGMYVVVFGLIFRSKFNAFPNETPVDYSLAVFMGLILFHITADTIAAAPTYIITSPNLVKKVVFPLEVLPLANTSATWFHFLISFALMLIACVVTGRPPSLLGLLWMPLILAPHILFTIGLSWILSALGVFFRDISQLVGFTAQVLLYASGVFIPIHAMMKIPVLWEVLKWNPLLHTIELSRRALLWDQPVDGWFLAYTWATGIAVFFVGGWFFRKWKTAFADVL
jgi:lipopolysaccharide transport system permease protein